MSTTTKLRVVCKTSTNISLNDVLRVGIIFSAASPVFKFIKEQNKKTILEKK